MENEIVGYAGTGMDARIFVPADDALAAAEGNCQINHVFKMQELCKKAIESMNKVLDNAILPEEKTADEMFRELEYTEKYTVPCGIRYNTEERTNKFFHARSIIVNTNDCEVEKAEYPNGFGQPITFAELRAVCKLLDEIGGVE